MGIPIKQNELRMNVTIIQLANTEETLIVTSKGNKFLLSTKIKDTPKARVALTNKEIYFKIGNDSDYKEHQGYLMLPFWSNFEFKIFVVDDDGREMVRYNNDEEFQSCVGHKAVVIIKQVQKNYNGTTKTFNNIVKVLVNENK